MTLCILHWLLKKNNNVCAKGFTLLTQFCISSVFQMCVLKIVGGFLVMGVMCMEIWYPDFLHPWIRSLTEMLLGSLRIRLEDLTGVPYIGNITVRLTKAPVIIIAIAWIGYHCMQLHALYTVTQEKQRYLPLP